MDWPDFHSTNLNGPAPTGFRPNAVLPCLLYDSGLTGLVHSMALLMLVMKAGAGAPRLTLIVESSTTSMAFEENSNFSAAAAFIFSSSAGSSFVRSMLPRNDLSPDDGSNAARSRFHLAAFASHGVPS